MKNFRDFVNQYWEEAVMPTLQDYIRIPNQSPEYDPDWQTNGHIDAAMDLVLNWVKAQNVSGLSVSVERLEGRTPLMYIDIEGDASQTVLLYGHIDKQPPLDGWAEGFAPYSPLVRDGKLYGRGSVDDGYAVFACIAAIKAVQQAGARHLRCVIIIECDEESGSTDLPFYVDALAERIGTPQLIICLDSGAGNYDQLWLTTSLRGIVAGTLRVEMLEHGVHSGEATGVVPSTFRIARELLSRIENSITGEILDPVFFVDIPPHRVSEAGETAKILAPELVAQYPFVSGAHPLTTDIVELLLNRTWKPGMEVISADGFPPMHQAGNVMRPWTALKLSLRIPPRCDSAIAAARLKEILEADAPYGARVSFEIDSAVNGWNAPTSSSVLAAALTSASQEYFGAAPAFMGEGGSIPFMNMLGERFPQTQFVITGVLGPNGNAHAVNEALDIAAVKKLTCCMAALLSEMA
ncbi:MAG: M20/M25/M40 family metallo-hydrolase [Candidatus Kerfeldbacteria bacterium]|nr:M20/M25/M40 family metallo-hydrolase [Candidatus Kerfeldbacteria bacterium]